MFIAGLLCYCTSAHFSQTDRVSLSNVLVLTVDLRSCTISSIYFRPMFVDSSRDLDRVVKYAVHRPLACQSSTGVSSTLCRLEVKFAVLQSLWGWC